MLNVQDPRENVRSFVRIWGSTSGQDTVTWFRANIHSFVPGEDSRLVCRAEYFNICRFVETDQGFDLIGRECGFYTDPETDEVMDWWQNPWTGERTEVIHYIADPANARMNYDSPRGPRPFYTNGDRVYLPLETILKYPSPLPRSEYATYSQNDLYQACELYTLMCRREDLENPDLAGVPTEISWVRVSPWLPWMEMGDRPGYLAFNGAGRKLDNGYADLPATLRRYVEDRAPQFRTSPSEMSVHERAPNAWMRAKQVIDARRAEGRA